MGKPLTTWNEILTSGTLCSQESITTLLNPFVGANIRLWDPTVMSAIAEKWNFAVKRQFRTHIRLSVAYVGQHRTHLLVPMPFLEPDTGLRRQTF